jgi:hypothetical protein
VKSDHARRVLKFQEFKRALPPLTAVLEHYGLLADMKRVGAQLMSSCPIHNGSNRKQFVVNPTTSEWKCFSPAHDKGGSTIEFVMAMQGDCSFQEATAHLARWFAIPSGNNVSQQRERRRSSMSGEKPSHKIFVVEGEGDSAFWHRAGSGWPHKDGKGLNLQIPSGMSLHGRVVLREYTADDADEDEKKVAKFKKK